MSCLCNSFRSQWMWKVIFWIWLVRSWPRVLLPSPHESVSLILPIIFQRLQNILGCFVSFAHTLAVPDKIFVAFSSQNIKVIIVINTLDMVRHWSSTSLSSTSLTHYHRHQHQYFHVGDKLPDVPSVWCRAGHIYPFTGDHLLHCHLCRCHRLLQDLVATHHALVSLLRPRGKGLLLGPSRPLLFRFPSPWWW